MAGFESSGRTSSAKIEVCSVTHVPSSTTIDLRSVTKAINIFNSLDSMVTSGYIDVFDQGNAIEEFKFNGKEIIDIEIHIGTQGASGAAGGSDFNVYSRRFIVYAIDNVAASTDQMTYRIRFVDPFSLLNTDNRISWHFKQTKGEDIIKKISSLASSSVNAPYRDAMRGSFSKSKLSSSQDLFSFTSDVSTQHDFDMYVPMMKPFELIRWVADRVVSSDNPCKWSDCLFYQTKDGKFHLNSFKNLFGKDPLVFTQQIAVSASEEKRHMIESYTFNKIYNIQQDKLNGIYGLQFAIADFKPTTKTVTQSTVLGTNIASNDQAAGQKTGDISLHKTITRYFSSLGSVNLSSSERCGLIEPFQCAGQVISSVQSTGANGGQAQVSYNTQSGALIFMDACGIIHEDDKTYNEYERVTLPYVTGCIMKKVLSTYVVNLAMNGAFDVDVGRSFTIKLNSGAKGVTRQMSAFVNGVKWLVSDVRHEWRYDTMQVKTYVTGFTPFLNRGDEATPK